MKTESKDYPKIQRSRKERMIFFPDNIQEIAKEDMEGIKETFYEYDLIKIPDTGQQIEDYEKFRTINKAEIKKVAYNMPLNRGWISEETIQTQKEALKLESEATTSNQMIKALRAQIKVLQDIIFGRTG